MADNVASILDPNVYGTQGPPYELFRHLRREVPVCWVPGADAGFWAVTRYEDVVRVSRDPERFSSYVGTCFLHEVGEDHIDFMRRMLINLDPPPHTKLRWLLNRMFNMKAVRGLEPMVRYLVREVVDAVAPLGQCDFVTEVAAPLPIRVILGVLGIPEADWDQVFEWTNRMIGGDDPEYAPSPEAPTLAFLQVIEYAAWLRRKRLEEPRDDLVSLMAHAQVDGFPLTEEEFLANFVMFIVAGNETTRQATAGGMLALLEHPQEKARLLENPSLLPWAVEEMVRWVSPINAFRRTATTEVRLGDATIRPGDRVILFYASANRDESVFPEPDRFDVGRRPNDHLGFGGFGPHQCLGANLARLELRLMIEELLRRLPDMELAGPVQRLRSSFINGVKHMPVRFRPRP